ARCVPDVRAADGAGWGDVVRRLRGRDHARRDGCGERVLPASRRAASVRPLLREVRMTWFNDPSKNRAFEAGEVEKIRWEVLPYTQGEGLDIGCGDWRLWKSSTGIDVG